jgi:N-ethylmaleimide reductase
MHAKTEFVCAAENALFAGFDGVELHSQRILTRRILYQ